VGEIIDVEFGAGRRERWCRRCDEPFPEGTALCPRCGGDLVLAARHRAEVEAAARRTVRALMLTVVGVVALVGALVLWLALRSGAKG
jgi:hypothetical protein